MIVECGQCKTKFKVADDKITPAGVKVRCSKCKHIFTVVRGAAGTPAPASPARIPHVEQPLSQPPGGDRGFSSQMDSKPIKKDSSWPPSAHLNEFQLLQVPDKIDQRMVDQIDLDSDAPLSVFDRDLPDAAPAPAPTVRDDLFHPLPPSPAAPRNIHLPEISFGEYRSERVSAPKGTQTAFDSDAFQSEFDTTVVASRSLPDADPFANIDIDVQAGSQAPPVPSRPLEPPPLPVKADRSSVTSDEAQLKTTVNEIKKISPSAAPQDDGGGFISNDPFADLEDYQLASGEGGSELTLDTDGKMFGAKPQTSPAPAATVKSVSGPKEKLPAEVQSASLPSADRSQRVPEKSQRLFWEYKIWFAVLACVGVLLLVVLHQSGGKSDLINGSLNDVLVKKITATTYRNINGHELLLFLGEVHYSSNETLTGITVTGRLLSDKGQALGEYTVPAGVVFTPSEIYQMGDASVVADEYAKKIEELKGKKLPPHGSLPFMIVAYDHPQITGEITARVVPSIEKD